MKRYLLQFCLLLLSVIGNAQQVLRGKVIGADTQLPVYLANVFLSNTSIGTVTDKEGNFIIQNFPSGRYDVVVSCVGYEVFVVTVQSSNIPPSLSVTLKPKVNELQEVIVAPYEKDGWEKYGEFFMDQFIGSSEYRAQCKLKNPKAIKFRYNKKENVLRAYADAPIILENRALGYLLKYDLVAFEHQYNDRITYYQGYPLFEDMNTGRKRVEKRWIKNRADAFYGSLMHFMRSLYRNKLFDDGFEVRSLKKVPLSEKKRVAAMLEGNERYVDAKGDIRVNDTLLGNGNKDSGFYYRAVFTIPRITQLIFPTVLPGDSIAFGIDSTTAGLSFRDYLQIVYRFKTVPREYVQQNPLTVRANTPVTSTLVLPNGKTIAVFANGTFYEGIEMLTSGFWGWWEKLATMLPYDYEPPPKESSGK